MSLQRTELEMRDEEGSRSQCLPARKLLAVVVIYRISPGDSSTLQTLLDATTNISLEDLTLKIVVWDNTPGRQDIETLPDWILYKAAPENPGLAFAYNQMLALAEAEGYEWLLTLDQDSFLPANFLKGVSKLIHELSCIHSIGAIVPQVISDGRMISPFTFLFGAVPRWYPPGFVGIAEKAAYPINSGAVLRVSALRQIDGYDPLFPLDISDISLFHRLQASGKQVFIAGDLLLRHHLALLKKEQRMSLERYDAILRDECAFWDMYMGPAARLERFVRLAGRILKDMAHSERAAFRKRTVKELKWRFFTTKRRRLPEWQAWAVLRGRKTPQK